MFPKRAQYFAFCNILLNMESLNEPVLTDTERVLSRTILRTVGKLTAYIKERFRNEADAEDIFQDVFFEFVQAYRLPESIDHVSS